MNSNTSLKIGVAQLCSVDDIEQNLLILNRLIDEASDLGAHIIFFPENCLYMRFDKKLLPLYLNLDSDVFVRLEQKAKDRNISIHLGGVGVKEDDKSYNASVFITPAGKAEVTYRKQKLFDIDLPGKHSYRESDAYQAGTKNSTLEIGGFLVGQSICFDLRFSDIYSRYRKQSVDAILIPSSFLVPTGEAHWHILNRARAIESQCYVISAAQSGNHKGKHQSYGHSLVVDPWGQVLLDMETRENSLSVLTINKSEVLKTKINMPMA